MTSRTRIFLSAIAVAAASLAVACSKPSALGNGSFAYECVSAPGAACSSNGPSIPASLPVGAHFKLTYTPSDTGAFSTAAVSPVSSDFFSVQNGEWVALRSGGSAVYATSGGLALDYTFLHVEGPTTADAH
jgi:hypothetical protein